MFRLRGRHSLEDLKWEGVEEDIKKDPDAAKRTLGKAIERHQRRQRDIQSTMPYGKEHWGGSDF